MSLTEIRSNLLTQRKLIGRGTSKAVFSAKCPSDALKMGAEKEKSTSDVAVYIISEGSTITPAVIKAFQTELSTLCKVQPHPNVMKVLGVIEPHDKELGCVVEYCNLGSLRSLLDDSKNKPTLTPDRKVLVAKQIADALGWIHSCQPSIVHKV